MRVLFIGGTGNISADCAAALHEAGHEICVVTRGKSAVPADYRVCVADRKDAALLSAATRGLNPDVVLNFLGYDIPDLETDLNVFQELKQYVFVSSATVYAKPPLRLPITEDAPLGNDYWEYARKKLACEEWLLAQHARTGYPVTIVRPSHTYSRRWIPNPVSSSTFTFARRLELGRPVFVMDEGQSPWTLTHTTDFAEAFAGLVGSPEAIGEAFHITSDEALPWMEIYREIASAAGVEQPNIIKIPTDFICATAPSMTGPLKGDKSHPAIFDNTKLRRVVPGFKALKSFAEGIRESVEWLRAHPEDQNLKPEVDTIYDQVCEAWRTAKSPEARA